MDYQAEIKNVYQHLEDDHIDKAVMTCLRIARSLQDFLYVAVFLREMQPNKAEFTRILHDDIKHLKPEVQENIRKHSLDFYLDTHSFDTPFCTNDRGEEMNVLAMGISEIEFELQDRKRSTNELQVPPGMGQYDTAVLADRYANHKSKIRVRIHALQSVRQRVKTRCLNYAIRIERQLEAQGKPRGFLEQIQAEVNNYFKAQSEDVYTKLLKASQLVDSNSAEDCALLLTEVRRAIKASADFFYPPANAAVKCADGEERVLGEEQYLNRLDQFLATRLKSSSSRDLLRAELNHLAVFARRLNEVASKGVHADVSPEEAKQGLVGLYMFVYNVTSKLQTSSC